MISHTICPAVRLGVLTVGIAALPFILACGKPKPPPMTRVEGSITVNGKPLPSARIRFIPTFPGFGAEVIAEGTSDTDGHFHLTCDGKDGACVGRHQVLVEEGSLPEELRGESGGAQAKMTNYLRSLSNRPIPAQYGNLAETPLEIDVKQDVSTYEIKLSR